MSDPTHERAAAPSKETAAQLSNHREDERLKQSFQSKSIDYYPNAEAWKPSATTTLPDLIEAIQGDDFADAVAEIRTATQAGDKDTAAALKKQLPAVSLSGEVKGRRKKALEEGRFIHSGLLQIDLDAKDHPRLTLAEMRKKLLADPHIVAVFLSPSGNGMKGVCRIPADTSKHKAAFLAAEKHFAAAKLTIDKSCKDPVRLCFVSHDPEAVIRDGIELDISEATDTERGLILKGTPSLDAATVADMLSHIPYPGQEDWLKITNAVWKELGVAVGTPILQAWAPEKTPGDYERRAKYPLSDITAGTLVHFAKENGWKAPPKKATHNQPPGNINFFYDGSRYYLDNPPSYIPMDCRSVSRHLLAAGVDKLAIEGRICQIQTNGFIHFAGPLAGHQRGVHDANGVRILATSSPEIIKAKPGEWPTLQAVLFGALEDPEAGNVQLETFLGWIKVFRESLVTGRRRPGQALALAGPVGSSKSLLIEIAQRMFGGRRANPYPYFTGRTNFNADLAGAELLAVDDDAGSTDIRARRALAGNIKSCLFSGAVRIEGKNKTAFTFRPCWRMMIALNDEPEALLVLPPVTEDIEDKLILLRCHRRPLPMPAHTLEQREAFFSRIMAELPAFFADLETWEIPKELQEERCGVRFYHHPAIIAGLRELSPEGQLLQLIDTATANGRLPLPWEGTASALRGILLHCEATSRDAEKLLGGWIAATGSYLARLEGSRSEKLPMLDGIQRWRLSSGVVE